jgi:ABC-type transport system substrate-binding protein
LVSSQLAEGAEVAMNFYPQSVDGWTDQVEQYAYDPEKAKSLLAEAGQSNLTLNFYWPTEVTRPYMPSPKDIFAAFKTDLEAVGITINEVSKPWTGGYLDGTTTQQADIYLLGWTGDYNTPDNFIGTFFGRTDNEFATSFVGRKTGRRSRGARLDPGCNGADRRLRGAEQADHGRVPACGSDLALAAGHRGRRKRAGTRSQPAHR